MANWVDWPFDDCERCGAGPEVQTDATQPDHSSWDVYVHDGDLARCTGCNLIGTISCDSETVPWVNWEQNDD